MVPHHPNDAMREIQEAQKEQREALEMLTKQLSQVAMSLGELRGNEGKIPATVQSSGREHISEVSLRSGRVLQGPSYPAMSPAKDSGPSYEKEGGSKVEDRAKEKGKGKVGGETSKESQKEEAEKVKPYPYRGMVTRRKEATIDVANMFKDVDVKVPLLTALKSPRSANSLKTTWQGRSMRRVEHAMCDLGASINVLPYSIYRKLGEAKLVYTDIITQLADRSCIHPEGILEDVIVKVNNFLYPADFFLIKMTEPTTKESSGVLLGRPFLSTASTIIDIRNGTISLDFKGEQYTFNIDEAMKRPADGENVYSLDVIEPLVQEEEFLNRQFTDSAVDKEVEKEVEEWF
ncbi:uncharacterized protein LOC121754555 [Salvia splendens]|uniref:uncharacterized protein LOC121754555 n=1 Tax=Salvia splendens TaxID=180675 RepID=UPI001C273EFD|nr:uncharacterized protein LOC121754555 [Salvia splendens]